MQKKPRQDAVVVAGKSWPAQVADIVQAVVKCVVLRKAVASKYRPAAAAVTAPVGRATTACQYRPLSHAWRVLLLPRIATIADAPLRCRAPGPACGANGAGTEALKPSL